MPFHVYILRCKDNTYYTGSTNDLARRLKQHNNSKSGAHYTKIRRPVTLVYSQECDTLSEARTREAKIKKLTRTQKYFLIKSNQQTA